MRWIAAERSNPLNSAPSAPIRVTPKFRRSRSGFAVIRVDSLDSR